MWPRMTCIRPEQHISPSRSRIPSVLAALITVAFAGCSAATPNPSVTRSVSVGSHGATLGYDTGKAKGSIPVAMTAADSTKTTHDDPVVSRTANVGAAARRSWQPEGSQAFSLPKMICRARQASPAPASCRISSRPPQCRLRVQRRLARVRPPDAGRQLEPVARSRSRMRRDHPCHRLRSRKQPRGHRSGQ